MRTVWVFLAVSVAALAQTQSIRKKTAAMRALPGYIPMYEDTKAGKLWLEIGNWQRYVLYYPSLPGGVGSNDLGLDRGQLGQEKLVRWERRGPKVLLVHVNTRYISTSGVQAERRSVADSFAESVLWGFEVAAEDGERVLVDATAFFLRDAHGVAQRLTARRQGTFRIDGARSALYAAKNFPKNTEVEVKLTFTSDAPGDLVRSVTPTPDALTVRQHHSFVELPDQPYRARAFDPRSGYYVGVIFSDYSTPLGETIEKRFIARHRISKGETLTYYLDPGAPEPVRSALLEGARWWKEAFRAAGFDFDVQMLPPDADPMDIRYNVIQWVHRSTRGWSYGTTVVDPRSGEILKGHVTLGSLRVRQDYMIAEGLLAPYAKGRAASTEMERMALARLRQLSAHEVGHTLGLTHNFAASVSDRASVMDYPHPLVHLNGSGAPDLSQAYATGIGEWDKLAIRWGYADDDSALAEARKRGFRFISDDDARPPGGAHPYAHLWDNGGNAANELERMLDVRDRALQRFGENVILPGRPMSAIEDVLVPVYLSHRYQVEAAAKLLGGLEYSYAVRGDDETVTRIVSGADQRRALAALMRTITAETLTLPEALLQSMPPRAYSFDRTRESFRSRTGLTFDPVAAAESAADLTLRLVLHPERAARLMQYHAREAASPSLQDVIDAVIGATWRAPRLKGLASEVQQTVQSVALYHLMALASADTAPLGVRAVAQAKLGALQRELEPTDAVRRHHADLIRRFLNDPKSPTVPRPLDAPEGQPI
jgi:hypothetical protein